MISAAPAASPRPPGDLRLVPAAATGISSGAAPWFKLAPLAALRPGRWVRLWYRADLTAEPVRPLLLVKLPDGSERLDILPAPILGRACAILRIPSGAREVLICPFEDAAGSGFAIERVDALTSLGLVRRAFRLHRGRTLSALGAAAIRWGPEYEDNLRWALGAQDLSAWPAFAAEREAPASGAAVRGPRVHLLMPAGAADDRARTLSALRAQTYPSWTLTLHDPAGTAGDLAGDPSTRILRGLPADLPPEAEDEDLVGVLEAGDVLAPHALACFAAAAASRPAPDAIYCDEVAGFGTAARPVFKPDWDPLFAAGRPYVGRLALLRAPLARQALAEAKSDVPLEDILAAAFSHARHVAHVRRPLLQRPAPPPPAPRPPARPPLARQARPAAIIIPTRDRAELLRACTESLLAQTEGPFHLVIVDNGTQDADALRLLQALGQDPRVTVIPAPGPFNYSALCNAGAAASTEDLLVFLNNDVVITHPDWLARLAEFAAAPETGAVGAKLLYPDGRIQHAGIVLGLGGGAGHFDAGGAADDPGWLERNLYPHAVMAVTGACLAVMRDKFDAVGGFDAAHMAIEFSDVDLCLRLHERGWRNVWTPFSQMIHAESASRGTATFRRLAHHGGERAYFLRRWAHLLRADPAFSRGLSLYATHQALA